MAQENDISKIIIGKHSNLQTFVTENLAYDGTAGKTKISIIGSDKKILKNIFLDGIWHCLGYVANRKCFLLVGEFQVGAWLPLTKIKYLSEVNFKIVDSKYFYKWPKNQNDPSGWTGVCAYPSENLKYVAFVGSLDNDEIKLMVLNTDKDSMEVLGEAPAPPPISDPHWQKEALRQCPGEWQWDFPCVDGYVEMDNGIIKFNKDTLTVSYGHDTVIKRSIKRKIKVWSLN
jgi:hypothetical protein